MKNNPFAWIEIPVTQMERAQKFYEAVFEIEINVVDFQGLKMGWFPTNEGASGASGSLVEQESYVPSHEGTLVYFGCEDVQGPLDRMETAGGKILQPKTQISPEHGYMGVFEDTEGNRVALYSQS